MAEIIDINVSEVVENIQITTTENITTVNINKVTGSGANWGEIGGTLSSQIDLTNALDLKADLSDLGATAFSNNYNDLGNKPTIPTLTSQLTNNSGFITNVITALGYTPEDVGNKSTSITTDSTSNTKYPSVKAVFDWANSVFTTSSAVATQIATDLVGYATQSWVNTGLATKQDKLQDTTGNIGVGKTDASATEKLDVNGNVKATGFKKDSGTANQSLTADGGVFDLNLKLSVESQSTTGTAISFIIDKVYGTLSTPETGNITADVTNAKLGVTNIIIHNSGTAPTFGSQFKKLSGSGNYVTGAVNYIYCTYISTTEIIYSINQRA